MTGLSDASPPRLIDVFADESITDVEPVLASRARLRSPYADYTGREDVVHLVGQIRQVLEDLRVVRQLADAETTMSAFEASVGAEAVQGVLVEQRDDDGRLADAMLTVRPYAGLRAAMRAMQGLMEGSPLPSRRDQR
jgi:hypothetical protein